MRNLLITVFLCITTISLAQQSGIKLGFQFSQDNISGEGALKGDTEYYYNRISRNEFNFSTGLTARFLTQSNLSFQTGVYYSQKDFKAVFSCPQCFYINSLTIAPVLPNSIKNRFLSIPFLIRYDGNGKKISPILEAGITNNFLVSDGEFNQTKPAFQEGILGLGLGFALNSNLGLEVKYNYRTALSSIYKNQQKWEFTEENDPNKLNTNSFQFGLSYILK